MMDVEAGKDIPIKLYLNCRRMSEKLAAVFEATEFCGMNCFTAIDSSLK